MNDKLCLEHGLSIVENPKPSREHYGTWLGNKKQPSFQEQICIDIDAALEENPKDFEELLKKLEAAGIEVNRERKQHSPRWMFLQKQWKSSILITV